MESNAFSKSIAKINPVFLKIYHNNQHNLSFLIENYSITVIPSYYSFLELSKISKSSLQNFTSFLGVGNPILRASKTALQLVFLSAKKKT